MQWKKCPECGGRIYLTRPESHRCTPASKDTMPMPRVKNPGLTAEYNIIGKEDVDEQAKQAEGKQSEVGAQTTEPTKPKKGTMTIAETKLGVTMVINKEEIAMLGIDINKTTKEAIQELRTKLGLKQKGVKK